MFFFFIHVPYPKFQLGFAFHKEENEIETILSHFHDFPEENVDHLLVRSRLLALINRSVADIRGLDLFNSSFFLLVKFYFQDIISHRLR
uniref:Uncharacterized protein n=1 Tax=Cucumis melo TaxID=3656 RepID=A0A9I9EL12_CUCME